MKKLTATALLIVTVFNFSCKKKETVQMPPQKTYLMKYTSSALGTFTYTYDAEKKMTSEKFEDNSGSNPSRTVYFTNYDTKGRLTDLTYDFVNPASNDIRVNVSYNANGKIERSSYYDAVTGLLNYYYTYDYNTASKVIVKFYTSGTTPSQSFEYTFSADGKNLLQDKAFNASGNLTRTITYGGYDNKISYDVLLPIGYKLLPIFSNNYTTNSVTIGSNPSTNYTIVNEYNADDYITKSTSTSGTVNTFEYTKQ
jgi:hypothetical protein